jgi:triphosphatase
VTENTEIELKLRLVEAEWWDYMFTAPVIADWAGGQAWHKEMLETQYYDTPGYSLQKARLAYRVRREGDKWLATVKGGGTSGAGLHQRQEWTVVVASPEPNITPFLNMPIGPFLEVTIGEEPLILLCTTRFERHTLELHTADGSAVEVAADRGEIVAGDQRAPILELELELKAGNPFALLHIGAALARSFPVLLEWRSKYYRGLQLMGLIEPQTSYTPEYPAICEEYTAKGVLTQLLVYCLQHVLAAHDEFLAVPENPEVLHNLRIQIRRLRSLWFFAQPLVPDATYQRYQNALGEWGQAMGPIRELDVALAEWRELVDSEMVRFTSKPVLDEKLTEKREKLVQRLHQTLTKGNATPLLLDFWACVLEAPFATVEKGNAEPVAVEFVRNRLITWLQEMVEVGKSPDLTDGTLLHNLRIQGKQVRYAVELLEPLLPNKTERIVGRLKPIQDALGYLHDVHITGPLLNTLLRGQSSRLLFRDTGLLTGWQAHKSTETRRKLGKQWKRFRRMARNWTNE